MGNHWSPEDDELERLAREEKPIPLTPTRFKPPGDRFKQQMAVGCLHSEEDIRLYGEAWLAHELYRYDSLTPLDDRLIRVSTELAPAIKSRLPFDCGLTIHSTHIVLLTHLLVLTMTVATSHRPKLYTLMLNANTGEATIMRG